MESLDGANCSQLDFTNRSCFKFSESGFKNVVWCRTGFSFLGAVMSVLAIIYFARLIYKKNNLKPADRLALYLCFASLFNGIFTAIQFVPVYRGLICDHVVANSFCRVASGLLTYSVWTVLVLMVWINVEIIRATFELCDEEKGKHSGCCTRCTKCQNSKYKYAYDGCVLATTLLFPIIFVVIPRAKQLYGLSGAWCWIKTRDDECHKINIGVIQQFVLWYAWAMIFIFVFIVTLVFVGVKLFRTKRFARDDPKVKDRYRRYLKETCHLALYPIAFSCIYGLGCVNRIIYAFNEKTILWLWIVHGIADALVSLLIPVFILSHRFFVWCCGRRHNDPERQPLVNEA